MGYTKGKMFCMYTNQQKEVFVFVLAITANKLFACAWLSVKASAPTVKPTPTSVLDHIQSRHLDDHLYHC